MTTVRQVQAGYSGCFATQDFATGEVVLALEGAVSPMPTRESIEIGPGAHIVDPHGSYVNHSFDPSCEVDQGRRCLVALRPLCKDDEITFDYNKNETSMACPFHTDAGEDVAGRAPERDSVDH